MSRVKRGVVARKRHKKILFRAKGYYGARSKVFRVAKQSVIKSYQYSYRDRRRKKRLMKRLWIIKINAAVRLFGLTYSSFIYKLKKLDIIINKKILSDIITYNKVLFNSIIEKVLATQ